ncbi:MAG TPA: hypothetical protein VGE72_01260 [Azospirillum sp.]
MSDDDLFQLPEGPGLILIPRKVLYEAVWSEPLIILADRLRTTTADLTHVCQQFAIPMPAQEYWTRIAAGFEHEPQPLPCVPTGVGEVVSLLIDAAKPVCEPLPDVGPPPIVEVEHSLTNPHPLIRRTAAKLKDAKQDEYGALRPGDGGLGVRVSPQGIDRAMSILDALLKTFQKRGHKCSAAANGDQTIIFVNGESLSIYLNERIPRKKHWPTKEENDERKRQVERLMRHKRIDQFMASLEVPHIRRWDYIPSNEFTLTIGGSGHVGLRTTWKDTPSRKLEAALPEIVIEVERHALAIPRIRAREEEKAKRREQERLRQEEEALRQRREIQRQEALERNAEQWERASRIRAYVAAVKARAEADQRLEAVEDWYEWALAFADSIDPITNGSGLP